MDDWPYETLIHNLKAVLAEVDARRPARTDAQAREGDAESRRDELSPTVAKPYVKQTIEP
jgi:hypothetical protein